MNGKLAAIICLVKADKRFIRGTRELSDKDRDLAATDLARRPAELESTLDALAKTLWKTSAEGDDERAERASHTPDIDAAIDSLGKGGKGVEANFGSSMPEPTRARYPDAVEGMLRLADGTLIKPPRLRPILRSPLATPLKSGVKLRRRRRRALTTLDAFLDVFLEEVGRAIEVLEQLKQWEHRERELPPVVVRATEVDLAFARQGIVRVTYNYGPRPGGTRRKGLSIEVNDDRVVRFDKHIWGDVTCVSPVPDSGSPSARRQRRGEMIAALRRGTGHVVWIAAPRIVSAAGTPVGCSAPALVERTEESRKWSGKTKPGEADPDSFGDQVRLGPVPLPVLVHDRYVAIANGPEPKAHDALPTREAMVELWLSKEQYTKWMQIEPRDILRRVRERAGTRDWITPTTVLWALFHLAKGRGGGPTRRRSAAALKTILKSPQKTKEALKAWSSEKRERARKRAADEKSP